MALIVCLESVVKDVKTMNILGIIVVALILVAIIILASTGLVNVPVVTSVFGFDRAPDLGVKTDPAIFNSMLNREGVTLTDPVSNYCLTCEITYSDPGPMDITVSSSELSSYLQATNNKKGPLKDIQIRLGDNNELEMAAYADLKEYGYDFKGPIYVAGRIERGSSNSVRLDVTKAKAGLVPVPQKYADRGESALEDLVNDQLRKMTGLRIDSLEIDDGQLHFKGNFPKTASAR